MIPKRLKFRKTFKGRLPIGRSSSILPTPLDGQWVTVALVSVAPGRLSNKQYEILKLILARVYRSAAVSLSNSRFSFSSFPYKPITRKPSEVRMGKGKGAVSHYHTEHPSGQLILSLRTFDTQVAIRALRQLQYRIGFPTQLIQLS